MKRGTIEEDLAALKPGHAEKRERELGASGPKKPDQTENLAFVEHEGDVLELIAAGRVTDFQRRTALVKRARPDFVLDTLAGHQLGQAVVVYLVRWKGADLPAVTEHRDALGNLGHLLEAVTDEDDSDAQLLQPTNRREQKLSLVSRER